MSRPLHCTYRLQLGPTFGFDAAASAAAYLAELGVSHVYASPYLQAAKGSTHGYDVVDHGRVSGELGGPDGHARFCRRLGELGLGQVLDIVPNHMATTADNPWWWDVLENGPSSRYAASFDIDWDPPEPRLHDKLLLPVLGDHYGRVLEAGELELERRDDRFVICYYDHCFPVAPPSLDTLLAAAAEASGVGELAFVADALHQLPRSTATDHASVRRRHRDKEVLRAALERLLDQDPRVAAAIDAEVAAVNAAVDRLDALLQRQNYRLAFWRAAGRDLGYRRFFDVNTLVGLRMEDERVFADTHALVLRWVEEGLLDGLRVDHPDGLRDPQRYLERLRQAAPRSWIVVEKILEPGEALAETWPVDGTTGYDFLNVLLGLFVDPRAKAPLTELYQEVTGQPVDYPALVRSAKHLVLRDLLGSDLNRLTELLVEVCEQHRRHRDYTRHELHEALGEYAVCLDVYRTYVDPVAARPRPADAAHVSEAVACAKAARPDLDPRLFDFLGEIFRRETAGPLASELVARLQQLTGSVMAKGMEDTLFYAFPRFLALNEVGGDPDRFGVGVDEFHERAAAAQAGWPRAMLATSTHDTKRSEDVRARLALLSEIPEEWSEAVRRFRGLTARHRTAGGPSPAAELLYYQTLVGAWPLTPERAAAYLLKAGREAKAQTSWLAPDEDYEAAVQQFVESSLADTAFVQAVEAFVRPLVWPGRVTSLAQTLVKLTYPGIPDIYQGCELWDLSLVDPDNRRPVDFEARRRLLREVRDASPEDVLAAADSGLPKLYLIHKTLELRGKRPELFGPGAGYAPLAVQGERAAHAVAFARGGTVATVVPRLVLGLARRRDGFGGTTVRLPEGAWTHVLTGEPVRGGDVALHSLLARFPVALLVRAEGRNS